MAFRWDYKGGGEMLRTPEMQAEMRRRAEKVAAAAEAAAPVYPGPRGGQYKKSFSVSSGVRERGSRRAFGRVTNDAPEAFYVEYGNRNTPRHRTLGRALDAAKD
jgi:Bacteriophage HK97-gp10, putative tail-component